MIPYGKQHLDQDDIKAVLGVLKSDFLTQGPKVAEFEKALAEYCGAKYAVVCANGTAALHLAYLAIGLKPGDEVITTPNTFAATANMVLALGAKPVFADIRLDNFNIDETKIAKLINKKIKAIVPVHFSGQSCEMSEIKELVGKKKIYIIEDACHALGAKYKKYKIGDCHFSDMALFSFHPVKSITTGEGGAILTNNKSLYEKVKYLRTHGIHKNRQGKNVMTELGFNYRITDMQCALGISQLKKLDKFIAKRRQIIDWYRQELTGAKQIILPQELKHNYSSWHLLSVLTKNPGDRDKLAAFLKEQGVGVNFHYPAVYSHPYYRRHGFKKTRLLNAEIYHKSSLTLPCYFDLSRQEVKFVCEQIKNYYKINHE